MSMRTVSVHAIRDAVKQACIEANLYLPHTLHARIEEAAAAETGRLAKATFDDMLQNEAAARELQIPICQDCGMAVVFLELGQEVRLTDGDLTAAVNDGVGAGYTEGYLRKSVVADPIRRGNTGDNTPAIQHLSIVPGDHVRVTVAPKGFGSENMSRLKMMNPSASRADIIGFIVETVRIADAKPCPPVVLGVGIGGDFEYAALLAKKALCRDVNVPNPDPFYAGLEQEALSAVNALGIGPQGYTGDCTALGVQIETYPTHIAGLPVAVNVGCHVTRHKTFVL